MSSRKRSTDSIQDNKPALDLQGPGQPAAQTAQIMPIDCDKAAGAIERMQLEVALYIESISGELKTMAQEAGLQSLAYFMEMARIEASIQVERRVLHLDET